MAIVSDEAAKAVAAVTNSKAAEKLADSVRGLVQLPQDILDYIVGPKRIGQIGTARAEVAIRRAEAEAEIERLRCTTADYVFDRELRKTKNREALLAEAQKSLPAPGAPVSDDPVSPDFVHTFFDEFDGISDPEIHKIAGRLLAGEVSNPGTFPRRTIRVLRDLESQDFKDFQTVCRFGMVVGKYTPVIFDFDDKIYSDQGVTFGKIQNLDSLGLVSVAGVAGFLHRGLPARFQVGYGKQIAALELTEDKNQIAIGKVMLTEAGRKLAPLTRASVVPGFFEYTLEKWRAQKIKAQSM